MLKAIALIVIVFLGLILAEAMFLMLAIGDMHLDWWPTIPPMGFSAAIGIAFCLDVFLTLIVGVASSASSGKS